MPEIPQQQTGPHPMHQQEPPGFLCDPDQRAVFISARKPLDLHPTELGLHFVHIKTLCAQILQYEVAQAMERLPVGAEAPVGLRAKLAAAAQIEKEADLERAGQLPAGLTGAPAPKPPRGGQTPGLDY